MRHATMFLEGKNPAILQDLMAAMETAAKNLEFEKAGAYRDQINHLRHVQEQQSVDGEGGDADVVAIAQDAGVVCIVVIIVRGGRVLGTKDYFPRYSIEQSEAELLSAFLGQYYFGGSTRREIPPDILVPVDVDGQELLSQALTESAGRETRVRKNVRGERRRWLDLAMTNARQTLLTHLPARKRSIAACWLCVTCWIWRKRRHAWSALTSATAMVKTRSHPAWFSTRMGR